MRPSPRFLPATILATSVGLGVLYAAGPALARVLSAGAWESASASSKDDAATVFARAEELRKNLRYREAATAYAKVIEREPYRREARFQHAWCLAAAGERDAFYGVMQDLVISEAKLSVDLLDSTVAKAWLSEPQFAALVREAHAQAMD
ncbi:MAG: hypothetical protein ACOYMV_04260 [Verrucomicrobiia bacterium]